jgi:DNA-binding NarL/FixJ family response regulator
MDEIRILLADDHSLLRAGVRALLEEVEGFVVVAEAADGQQALALVETHRPHVLVTDISMPDLDGLELASRVTRAWPETRVLVLSMFADRAYATKAMASGAAGYLLKDALPAELEAAVRAVARGESYLSPVISAHVVADYARLANAEASGAGPLTPRQLEVLRLVAEGLPTKGIARQLGISVKTAEAHRSQLMERLDIHDVAGLVRYALRTGLIPSDP